MTTISINGPDNIGKTTQIKLLPNEINRMGSLVINEMPKENSSDWWFKECATPDFTKFIVAALKGRQRKIADGVNIFDRGTLMFKAVCTATAAVKNNINIEKAYKIVNTFFENMKKEDVQVFLKYGQDSESIEEMKNREVEPYWNENYINYQNQLRKAIEYVIKFEPKNIVEIECKGKSVIDIQNEIRAIISKLSNDSKSFQPILKTINCIFGIGGLSESGKSFCGQYLREKHNFIPLKKIYFDELSSIHNGKSIYDETAEDNARLTILELDRFCKAHYYFPLISIESLRNYQVTKEMKKMLGGKFVIIYLEADNDARYERASDKEKEMFVNKEKTKKSAGADEIKGIADNVILNNGRIEELHLAIDKIVDYQTKA